MNRYRVLVVDDERLIREGLRGLIDWPSLGFEVVATASDGTEALEYHQDHPVDLILADIRMPRTDGFGLLETLRARGDGVRFVFLSGFAEFEYARRALSLRIDGYLLKPVEEDDLVARLTEVRTALDQERFSVSALIDGVSRLPPAYDWGRWQVLLLETLSSDGHPRPLDPEAEDRLRRVCQQRGWGEVFFRPPLTGVLLRQVYPRGQNLTQLSQAMAMALTVPWSGAVGEVVTQASAIADSHQSARHLLGLRFFSPPNTIVWQSAGQDEPPPEAHPSDVASRISLILGSGNPGALRALVENACASWAPRGEAGVREALATALASGDAGRVGGAWMAELWRQPFLSSVIDSVVEHLSVATGTPPDPSSLVDRLKDIVETRFFENLKLEALAEAFQYNSAYLGKLFRAKTGQSFHSYLDQVRVAEACRLLKQDQKVHVVAEQVGYRYVDYFHAKFRKLVGCAPSHYHQGVTSGEIPDFHMEKA